MAYIVKIKTVTKTGQNIDDVVSIQDDKPSTKEYDIFTIEEVTGKASDIIADAQKALPEIKMAWWNGSEWCAVEKEPVHAVRRTSGVFSSNLKAMADNAKKITEVSAKSESKNLG